MGSFYAKFGENFDDKDALAKLSMADTTRLFTESAKILRMIFARNEMDFSFNLTPSNPDDEQPTPATADERLAQAVAFLDAIATRKAIESAGKSNSH